MPKAAAQQKRVADTSRTAAPQGARHTPAFMKLACEERERGLESSTAQEFSLRDDKCVCALPDMWVRLKLSQLDGRQKQHIIIHPR